MTFGIPVNARLGYRFRRCDLRSVRALCMSGVGVRAMLSRRPLRFVTITFGIEGIGCEGHEVRVVSISH
jgi:hypothetical protein